MDKQLTNRKLLSLKRCLDRISLVLPASAQALKNDVDAQDIISINLQRAVQLCVDLALMQISQTDARVPDTMAGAFSSLNADGLLSDQVATSLTAAVGFRNISVHQYDAVDWDIVFAICTKHLGDLTEFARIIDSRS